MHYSGYITSVLSLLSVTISAGPVIPHNNTTYGAANMTANSTTHTVPAVTFLDRGKKPPKTVEQCLPGDSNFSFGFLGIGTRDDAIGFRHWAEPNCPCDKESNSHKIGRDRCHNFKQPGDASFTYKLPENKHLHGCDIRIFDQADCFGNVVMGLSGVKGETADGDGRNRACMPMTGDPGNGQARSVYVGPCVRGGHVIGRDADHR